MFANGPGNRGSILGRVIPKTQKMVLDAALLNTHHYKVRMKSKWCNPGKVVAPSPLHLSVEAIEKGAFGSPLTTVGQLICKISIFCSLREANASISSHG